MALSITAVLLVYCIYMAFGATVDKQDGNKQTIRDIKRLDRGVKIVKRACRVSTFESEAVGKELQKNGNPIFLDTISDHEGIFLDSVPAGITFDEIMKDIFNHRSINWKNQRAVITRTLPCSTTSFQTAVTVGEFYISIVFAYTTDCIYKQLNNELRNFRGQSNSQFGSYALILNVILSQWTSLAVFSGTTYHGVADCVDIEPYTVNTIFTWTGFTSSSSNISAACMYAKEALFIIDNSVVSDWRPISIEDYSNYPHEAEYLYPTSAIFKVTSVEDGACGKFYVKKIRISLQRGQEKQSVNGGTMKVGRAFAAAVSIITVVILV